MKMLKFNLWMLVLLVIMLLIFAFIAEPRAQALNLGALSSNTIIITNQSPTSTPVPVAAWNYLDKLYEAENLVASASLTLKVGTKDIVYSERRINLNAKGIPIISSKRMTDPEREIALVILDTKSGDLELVKITERGNDLTYPMEYEIRNVERSNGITNNAWNTCRKVSVPENKVIILNVWPHYITERVAKVSKDKRGRTVTTYQSVRLVENVVYAPYCDELHISEFINSGADRRKSLSGQAFNILRDRGVMSQAFPGKLIADVEYLKPEYFERLPLIEHMDYGEFARDPKKSAERVDVIVGTNGDKAYGLTCSSAGACGWLQYTRTTWNAMRKKYPKANLPTFELGAPHHLDSMVGAILLHDNNLASAIREFGPSVLNDANQLEEMLAANYNGGTVRPYRALKASILQSLEDWLINPMRTETKQYIEKLRYIRTSYNN